MSKKTLKTNIESRQDGSCVSEIIEMTDNNEAEAKSAQIYLRDTLIQMDEFKKYGLNQYFLRAILKENYYTLDKAHKLVQDFFNNH